MKYYIAYGSNLNVRQMMRRCPDARLAGTSVLFGYELLFKGSKTGSYLTVEKKRYSTVPIAIWQISEADEKKLDRYEGFPDFYYKKPVPLKNVEGEAFMYVMHEDRPLGIPSAAYYEVCRQGYEDFGFTEEYLKIALTKSKEVVQV